MRTGYNDAQSVADINSSVGQWYLLQHHKHELAAVYIYMCVYAHIYMYIYIYVCIYTYMLMYAHIANVHYELRSRVVCYPKIRHSPRVLSAVPSIMHPFLTMYAPFIIYKSY